MSRGAEIVNRGLQSLDELEEDERAEAEAVVAIQSNRGVDIIN